MDRKRTSKALATGAGVLGVMADLASGGAGVVSGLAQGAFLVFEKYGERQQARAERLLSEAFEAPDEQFADALRAKLAIERVRDAVLEAMRGALESLSDEVIPALGGLIREYERQGLAPDGFFRGLCYVLKDLSGDEFRSFVAIIRCVANPALSERGVATVRAVEANEPWADAEGAPMQGSFVMVVGTGFADNPPMRKLAVVGANPHDAPRLFHLLDREGLARKRAEGRSQDIRYCEMDTALGRRIAALLPSVQ